MLGALPDTIKTHVNGYKMSGHTGFLQLERVCPDWVLR